MRKLVLLSACSLILFAGCQTSCADTNVSRNESVLASVFSKASGVVIKYRRIGMLGPRPPSIEDINERWDFQLSKNCSVSCIDKDGFLYDYLGKASVSKVSCDQISFAALTLYDNNGTVLGNLGFHPSGRCFVYNDKSYILETSFLEYLKRPIEKIL